MTPGTALIVGAGMGGLSAAIALRRAGFQVRVFEQAATPRELGFGVALAPSAIAALRELVLRAMPVTTSARLYVRINRRAGTDVRHQ